VVLQGKKRRKNNKIRAKVMQLNEKGVDVLSLEELSTLVENLRKIDAKLPHQQIVCQAAFDQSLLQNDWKFAAECFASGYLTQSIIQTSDEVNPWNFVLKSTPVCINNQLYIFPNY
jgi:hypothetical protein